MNPKPDINAINPVQGSAPDKLFGIDLYGVSGKFVAVRGTFWSILVNILQICEGDLQKRSVKELRCAFSPFAYFHQVRKKSEWCVTRERMLTSVS